MAKPEKHWRTGFSAKTLAHCWQAAESFPPCVVKVFKNSRLPEFQKVTPLLAIPEHKVHLPGGKRASQNDLFVLASNSRGLLSITVEGKVAEPFGPLVHEWLADHGADKKKRLEFLCERLGVLPNQVRECRYQLLHRTVSAILEARRFGARAALMLVHSFSDQNRWYEDYERFAILLGARPTVDSVSHARQVEGIEIFLGWACGDRSYLNK